MEHNNMNAKIFSDYLTQKGLKGVEPSYRGISEGSVHIPCVGSNREDFFISCYFTPNYHGTYFSSEIIFSIPEDKIGKICITCSQLNQKYRWIKFYVTRHLLGSYNPLYGAAQISVIPSEDCETCYKMLLRVKEFIDIAYPVFLETLES